MAMCGRHGRVPVVMLHGRVTSRNSTDSDSEACHWAFPSLALKGQDADILAFAYAYEQATMHRLTATITPPEEAPEIAKFMEPLSQ